MTRITEHLEDLKNRISAAALVAGRDPALIQILAVSKKHPLPAVRKAAAAGITRFGENYVQEALIKIREAGKQLEWHFIGTIQSNKTRAIAENFDWVQTISDQSIAERLNRQRPQKAPELQVCIQVQLDDAGTHSGVDADEVPALAESIGRLPRLRLRGLMGMPMPAERIDEQRIPFQRLRMVWEDLQARGYPVDTLSMGMSNDLEAAIREGTTMLRIGTAIFGPRDQQAAE